MSKLSCGKISAFLVLWFGLRNDQWVSQDTEFYLYSNNYIFFVAFFATIFKWTILLLPTVRDTVCSSFPLPSSFPLYYSSAAVAFSSSSCYACQVWPPENQSTDWQLKYTHTHTYIYINTYTTFTIDIMHTHGQKLLEFQDIHFKCLTKCCVWWRGGGNGHASPHRIASHLITDHFTSPHFTFHHISYSSHKYNR